MNNQYQQKQEVEEQKKQQTVHKTQQLLRCPNCGSGYSATDLFCAECGMGLKNNVCKQCNAAIEGQQELCPQCGSNLNIELCSFCGGKMTPEDAFCPECGSPRTGIICDDCKTLNFRNFCRKCGKALTSMALEALESAKNDPLVKQAIKVAEELAELEEYLLSDDEQTSPEFTQLSDENKKLIDNYKDILSVLSQQTTVKPEEKQEAPPPASKPKPTLKLNINIKSKEDAMAAYKAKLQEMQATLDAMIPDTSMTPQMQRDYYTARKLEIQTKTKIKIGWICNAYGCFHDGPNDCSKPWQGGKWIYEDHITTIKLDRD